MRSSCLNQQKFKIMANAILNAKFLCSCLVKLAYKIIELAFVPLSSSFPSYIQGTQFHSVGKKFLFMNKEPSVNKSGHYPKRLTPVSLFLLFLAYWQSYHFLRVLKFCFRARQNLASVPESCQSGTYLPASMLANFSWTGLVEYGSDQLKE